MELGEGGSVERDGEREVFGRVEWAVTGRVLYNERVINCGVMVRRWKREGCR